MSPLTGKRTLRLILGDQLDLQHSWFSTVDDEVTYLIAELHQETTYIRHHRQKVCGIFAAMEAFAISLDRLGHKVLHLTLDDTSGDRNLPALLLRLCKSMQISHLEYQQPDSFRVAEQLQDLCIAGVTLASVEGEHFFLPHSELADWFEPGKAHRMEAFYRKMRRRFDLLMHGEQPVGGQWNFDSQNRNKLRKTDLPNIPAPLLFSNDVRHILQRLDRHGVKTIGRCPPALPWPITHDQANQLLRFFCRHLLPDFGTFQDAMTANSPNAWSLYHSRLSFALNVKLLDPKTVVQCAIKTFEESDAISLAQVEGFVRQILGWREFVRGMYWRNMPAYLDANYFNAQRSLPSFFWDAKTSMRCLSHAIGQSLDFGYAHHIQRLMVTGTFCLLAGIKPDAVDEWYLGIYVDGFQWAELPNTRGMSQFADGGLIASKPYAASGNYINKMSDYCGDCGYDVKLRHGNNACPFNSLYWDFLARHRSGLATNGRMGMAYRNWDRLDPAERESTLSRAASLLLRLDTL